MPEGSSIGPRKLAQSDLDIPSAGLTDVSYWQIVLKKSGCGQNLSHDTMAAVGL